LEFLRSATGGDDGPYFVAARRGWRQVSTEKLLVEIGAETTLNKPKASPSYLLKWPQRHKNHKTQSQQISQNGQATHEEIKKSPRLSKIRQNIPSLISTSY
jgi:hypothetical protein